MQDTYQGCGASAAASAHQVSMERSSPRTVGEMSSSANAFRSVSFGRSAVKLPSSCFRREEKPACRTRKNHASSSVLNRACEMSLMERIALPTFGAGAKLPRGTVAMYRGVPYALTESESRDSL